MVCKPRAMPRREEPLADQPEMILDLPLLPAGSRLAGRRSDDHDDTQAPSQIARVRRLR
jgi:hypothetical protein